MRIPDDYWHKRGYILEDYCFEDFPPGARILDVGCGFGVQMETSVRKGIRPVGVDNLPVCLEACQRKGLVVIQSMAESLSFKDDVFDGMICKVVLPLTDENQAIAEMARVLKRGGELELSAHGLGYYLHYLLFCPVFLTRVYAALTILNTWIYRATGRRWRTTIYQSQGRLERLFYGSGLEVVRLTPSKKFAGFPVFVYYRLRKKA